MIKTLKSDLQSLYYRFLSERATNKSVPRFHKKRRAVCKYTVICAVYNVDRYLEQFFLSLTRQTIDFRHHIQLIMIDDGSTDSSSAILDAWLARYPGNISVIKQPNSGQASARNAGLPYATGEWVTFIDPDDFVDTRYFEMVDRIVSQADKDVGLISCRPLIFNDRTGWTNDKHPLRIRFADGTQTYDPSDPRYVQLSVNSAFFKRINIVDGRIKFNTRVRPSFEDGHFVSLYLLSLCRGRNNIVFCANAIYFYRKRSDGSSTLDGAWLQRSRYDDQIRYGYLELLEISDRELGQTPSWLQRVIIYDLFWHFHNFFVNGTANSVLTDTEKHAYLAILKKIGVFLTPVEIENNLRVVLAPFHTVGMLYFFTGQQPNYFVADILRHNLVDNTIKLKVTLSLGARVDFASTGGEVEVLSVKRNPFYFLYEPYCEEQLYRVYLSGGTLSGYCGGKPILFRHGKSRSFGFDHGFEGRSRKNGAFVVLIKSLIGMSGVGRKYNRAWLFIDKDNKADDNAEHLYRYIANNERGINSWFIIDRNCRDWSRLTKDGFRIIPFGSLSHKIALLLSSHLISSHADRYVWNFLDTKYDFNRDSRRFIFLQHGVITVDLSGWLNKIPIDLMLTSMPSEYHSIVDDCNSYHLTKEEVALTGLPRHDRLIKKGSSVSADSILIMPTWRRSLTGKQSSRDSSRAPLEDFSSSDFFHRWRSFLQSDRLFEIVKASNLKIIFHPHPNLEPHVHLFCAPNYIDVVLNSAVDSMQYLLLRSKIVLTDYSSIACEAAVLNRDVLYYQFDRHFVFGGGHIYDKGYFDYEKDGFGPVAITEEDLLDLLERSVRQRTPEVYALRRARSFPLRDGECCKRAVLAIKGLEFHRFQSYP